MLRILALLTLLPLATLRAADTPDDLLRQLVARETTLFDQAKLQGEKNDADRFETAVQHLANDYEKFLTTHPDNAPAHVTYARLLDRVGMRKQSTAHYRAADRLDHEIPFVKNQLGKHLAEDGNPIAAQTFFLSAIQLAPSEPLYHFQLGNLLIEARDDFIRTGNWPRALLEKTALEALTRAHTLAPDDPRYAYRLGLAYYDIETPDWPAALAHWQKFETTLDPGLQQQTCRLHQAKILFNLNRPDDAHSLLATIDEPSLAAQKEKLPPAPPTPAPQ